MTPTVLVAFESSGIVRDAFLACGFDAVSCDLTPSERPGPHYVGDVLDMVLPPNRWDILIAHPPCTDLSVSGSRWFANKRKEQLIGLALVKLLLSLDHIPRICVENPVSVISTYIRRPDQIIQPWMFGHAEVKTTCLWLKNLPALRAVGAVAGTEQRTWRMPPGPNRARDRSRTYQNIAKAMATQWGPLLGALCDTTSPT